MYITAQHQLFSQPSTTYQTTTPLLLLNDNTLLSIALTANPTTINIAPRGDVTIDIAPRGDVILVCNGINDPAEKIRLRTSSHVLQLGSSVFVAMLGPHFKEGSAFAVNGTVEIELPEDDTQAMTTMCKIMHISPDIMEKIPTPKQLDLLAQHADKYDTVRALGTATYYWITEAISRKGKKDMACRVMLLGAALTFEHAGLFDRIGRDIVMQWGPPWKLPVDDCPENVSEVLRDLREFRNVILLKMVKFIDERMDSALGAGNEKDGVLKTVCPCNYLSTRAAIIFRQLRREKLWPSSVVNDRTLESTIQTAKGLKLAGIAKCNLGGERGPCLGKDGMTLETFSKAVRDEACNWGTDMRICLKCAQGDGMRYVKKCVHR